MQIISLNMHDIKNVPSRNEFYGKNYPRINWQKFDNDDYHVVLGFALSIKPWSAKYNCVNTVYCSYKLGAMEKLKMSNVGATDVYTSNSRCVRNNDKPVDNNVFTGRLPVSARPQLYQWQQHHQQLLMQADNNVELFADSGHSVWAGVWLDKHANAYNCLTQV